MSEMTLLPEISSTHQRDEADELSMDDLEVVVGGAPVRSWIGTSTSNPGLSWVELPAVPLRRPIASSPKNRAVAITA